MIDTTAILDEYLSAQSGLTTLISTRLWGDRAVPPPGYKPSHGGSIAYKSRGGPPPDYSSQILKVSYQFKCYGETEILANGVYRKLFDVLHDKQYKQMMRSVQEIAGQSARERAMEPNDWPYVLTFFMLTFRNSA